MNAMKLDDIEIGETRPVICRDGGVAYTFDFGEYGELFFVVPKGSAIKFKRTTEKLPAVLVQSLLSDERT